MKRTLDLSNKTKTELTALAKRKKIPVTSGMLKEDLVKTIKKGLRKIEAQKTAKPATAKTSKKKSISKSAKKTPKNKSAKKPAIKTARKPKSLSRKTTAAKRKAAPVRTKKAAPKKSPVKAKVKKAKVKKAPAKKAVARKPKKTVTNAPVQKQRPLKTGETPSELPERYGDHTLVVLARDPNWAYTYWDLNTTRMRELLQGTGQTSEQARWILRVYFAALHPVEAKGHYFDVDIDVKTGSYYLDLSRPGARFIVEIGVIDASGLFRATAQSNPVILPLDHPSEITEGSSPSTNPPFAYGGSSPSGATSPEGKPGDATSGSGFSKPPSSGSE